MGVLGVDTKNLRDLSQHPVGNKTGSPTRGTSDNEDSGKVVPSVFPPVKNKSTQKATKNFRVSML